MASLIIIGCGSKKKNKKSQAQNLYTSTYFKLKKRYAKQHGDEWLILSAKHGLIKPEKIIEPYEAHIKNRKPKIDNTKLEEHDEIEILAGKRYTQYLKDYTDTEIKEKFKDTKGIGDQMSILKRDIE